MVKHISAQLAALAFATLTFAAEPPPPPDLSDARVTLPYPELKALWQAAQRETPEKRKPPVEAALLFRALPARPQRRSGGRRRRVRDREFY